MLWILAVERVGGMPESPLEPQGKALSTARRERPPVVQEDLKLQTIL